MAIMGRMLTMLTILICIDILLIVTGQVTNTLGSILFSVIADLPNLEFSQLFKELIGDFLNLLSSPTGIAQALTAAGVLVGFIFAPSDLKMFIPIAISLAGLAADYIGLAAHLASLNYVVAIIIMAPICMIYVITVVEWLKGTD